MRRLILVCVLIAPLHARAATAGDHGTVEIRVGNHAGFGRVVFDFPAPVGVHVEREGDRVHLRFDADMAIPDGARMPRNVRAIGGGESEATIDVAPGSTTHMLQLGNRVALDVFDARSTSPPGSGFRHVVAAAALANRQPRSSVAPSVAASASPPIAPGAATHPVQAAPSPIAIPPAAAHPGPAAPPRLAEPVLAAPPPVPAVTASAPNAPAQPAPMPPPLSDVLALAARKLVLPPGQAGAGISLPFDPDTGAAAFRRGSAVLVVFDERRPIDLSALRGDPAFGAAVIELLPAATVLRMPLGPAQEVHLLHQGGQWAVIVAPTPATLVPIRASIAGHAMRFAAGHPGAVVSVQDAQTGETLLVGTQKEPGEGMVIARRAPDFAVLPTWQGVAVAPLSDRPVLRRSASGFVLESGLPNAALALATPSAEQRAVADAAPLSRRFDFPARPVADLVRRLHAEIATSAQAPPLARFAPRLRVAQAMIALGLGAEAAGVLRLAMEDDPQGGQTADAKGLAAIAALLAGRLQEASALDDKRLDGSDEIALWRAVRAAMQNENAPEPAKIFATDLAIILAYPQPLRDRLLPLAAETMVQGGQEQAAARLLTYHAADRALDFARALLAEKQKKLPAALAAYDALAGSRDRRVRARAAIRAIDLRFATGALTAAHAADLAGKQLYSWRGDAHELHLRMQIAAWRQQAGQWRQALDALRDAEIALPDDRAALHAKLAETFATLMRDPHAGGLSDFDLVTVAQENADLLPAGADGEAAVERIADRLQALDLPGQAELVLEKLLRTAPAGATRAAVGARLAALRLGQKDDPGALAALSASEAGGIPAALAQHRAVLRARAVAGNGDSKTALASIAEIATPEADQVRAALFEQAHDWPEAESALAAYAASVLPAEGKLNTDQTELALRLASAAAQAGDDAALADLRARLGTRLADQASADMFQVLTDSPIRAVSDLPRAAREAAAARTMAAAMNAPAKPGP